MRLHLFRRLPFVALLALGCQASTLLSARDYEVYREVLTYNCQRHPCGQIIIRKETRVFTPGMREQARKTFLGVDGDKGLWKRFAAVESAGATLDSLLELEDYRLISREELLRAYKVQPRGWTGFYKTYPESRGLFSLSRIGFKGGRALLYTDYGYSLLGSESYLWILKRSGHGWTVTRRILVGTS